MEKEQLTLNDLCGYLPYGLKWQYWIDKNNNSINTMSCGNMPYVISDANKKPIFRNLATDLTREIEHGNETVTPLDWLFKNSDTDASTEYLEHLDDFIFKIHEANLGCMPIWIADKLRSWHFWLGDQSYFENKTILDYNDVNGL